jgi:uncharacterized OB-fold protein
MVQVIRPNPTKDDQYFWDGLEQDKLLIRACASCGRLQHPPTPMCPQCGATEWELRECSGRGTVYSWVVSHHPNEPDEPGRIVVLLDLADGVRMVGNLTGIDADAVRVGLPVELTFETVDGMRLPQFVPAQFVPAQFVSAEGAS